MNNNTIIFDADPFCYGPISTTLNLVRYLKEHKSFQNAYKFILLGTNTTRQLAENTGLFDEILECNTTQHEELSKYDELVKLSKLYISNTNPTSIQYFKKHKIPKIYIDTLFWMWDDLKTDFLAGERVYIQNFVLLDRQIQKFANKLGQYTIVNPLINTEICRSLPEKDFILINFGGIETVYANTTPFYELFMDLLVHSNFFLENKFIIAGGGKTIKKMKEKYESCFQNILCINSFGQREFIDLVVRAKKYITSPGLTSFYECCFLEKDVFFLPPQNYSQYLQLSYYKKNLNHVQGLLWSEIEGYHNIEEQLPENLGIEKVQAAVKFFMDSHDDQQRMIESLDKFLNAPKFNIFFESKFKFDYSGVIDIANDIVKILG